MTRRLGGTGSKSLGALASLSLAGALACGFATTGCGGDNNGTQDAGPDATPSTDGGTDAKSDATDGGGTDASQDVNTTDHTVPDAAPDTGPDVVIPKCTTPTFNPTAGAIASGTTVAIASANLPTDGFIFYTTDGTLPTHTSPAYSGPIQVSQAETIRALAFAQGECDDSTIASAVYTIQVPEGGTNPEGGTAPTIPVFAPPSETSDNNFALTLTSTTGATICYTTDGSTPSCSATATCSGTSVAYSGGAGGISVSPTITNAVTGQVSVSAIACTASGGSSAVATQSYTLKAATPTMTNPAPSAVTWTSTVQATLASTTNGASLYLTTDGSTPQCGVASELQASNPVLIPLKSFTYNVIACKTGFAPSAVGTFSYHVTLTTPVLSTAAATFSTQVNAVVNDTANLGSTDWVCASQGTPAGITAPSCGAMLNTCGTGSTMVNNLVNGLGSVTIAADGNELQALACSAANLTASGIATSGPYVLKLSTPAVSPSGLVPNANPTTSYTLAAPDTIQVFQTGANQVAAHHACFVKNPATGIVPSCNAAACGTGSTLLALNTDSAASFAAGDSISVLLCPNTGVYEASSIVNVQFVGTGTATTPTISPGTNTFTTKQTPTLINTNNAAVTACYTTDGSAPTCTTGTCGAGSQTLTLDGQANANFAYHVTTGGAGYTNAVVATLSDGNPAHDCSPAATVTGGAITALAAGTCTTNNFAAPPAITFTGGNGSLAATATFQQTVTVTIANPGTGYLAGALNFTTSDGNGSCASGTKTINGSGGIATITLSGCTGFTSAPRITINPDAGPVGVGATATTALSTTQTVHFTIGNGGLGYESAPTVVLTGGGGTCTTAGVATVGVGGAITAISDATGCTGYTSNPTVSFTGGGVGAAANVLPSNMAPIAAAVETDQTVISAVSCNAGLAAATNANSVTYTMNLATPTITPGAGNASIGSNVTIATTSNFTDTQIVFTTDGSTPVCPASGGTPTGSSVTTPVTFTTAAIQAIACGANQDSTVSVVNTATLTPTVATPTIASTVGNVTLPGVFAQNGPITATITSPTAGTYLCYQLGGNPSCSTTTVNGCDLASTKGTSGASVSIVNSGSRLRAVACSPGATLHSGTADNTYTLAVTPFVFGTASATCGGTTTIGFDNSTTALAQDATEGGFTPGASICYADHTFTYTCGNVPPTGVTCFTPTAGNLNKSVTVNTPTIFALSCLPGFVGQNDGNSPASPTLTQAEGAGAATYTRTITVDGTVAATEWATTTPESDMFASGTAGINGGFSHDNSNVDFLTTGFTPLASTHAVIYLSDGQGTAMDSLATGVPAEGGGTLPFAAEIAVSVNTNNSATIVYVNNGTTWSVQVPAIAPAHNIASDILAGNVVNAIEASIPVGEVTQSNTVLVSGAIVTGFGGVTALSGEWPQSNGAWGFVQDELTSCQTPVASVQ